MSSKKKALWLLGGVLVLAAGFLGLVFWLGDEGPISPAGFARLRAGMTAPEVLGSPPPPRSREALSGEAAGFTMVAQWGESLELPRNSVRTEQKAESCNLPRMV